ncbi:MAG TPA: hypothetical protein DCX80_02560 [Chloroflexi bacterium]|nr:hypothetical protein [Chloroflexota bacterium]HBY44966.1 hypothetical protein [Chloroflexota bacterium]
MIAGQQTTKPTPRRTRPVSCDECSTPIAEFRAHSGIVIRSRHHGEWHVTVITLDQIKAWLVESERVA